MGVGLFVLHEQYTGFCQERSYSKTIYRMLDCNWCILSLKNTVITTPEIWFLNDILLNLTIMIYFLNIDVINKASI